MTLPIFQSKIQEFMLMQTRWAGQLSGLLSNPSLQSNILSNISLIDGTTIINHLLGRKLVGWRIIGINGVANIYDLQSSNQTPELTLQLVSSAAVIVKIEVF